jgi:hypothetical protein
VCYLQLDIFRLWQLSCLCNGSIKVDAKSDSIINSAGLLISVYMAFLVATRLKSSDSSEERIQRWDVLKLRTNRDTLWQIHSTHSLGVFLLHPSACFNSGSGSWSKDSFLRAPWSRWSKKIISAAKAIRRPGSKTLFIKTCDSLLFSRGKIKPSLRWIESTLSLIHMLVLIHNLFYYLILADFLL